MVRPVFYFILSFYHNLKLYYKKLGHKKTRLKKINMKTKKSVKWKTKTHDNHPNSFDILTSLGARISPQGWTIFCVKNEVQVLKLGRKKDIKIIHDKLVTRGPDHVIDKK